MVSDVLGNGDKKWFGRQEMTVSSLRAFLIQSHLDFLFFKDFSHLLLEKDLFSCPPPPSLLGLCCHRWQGNDVVFQRCRLRGENTLFPSSWRVKKKKKKKQSRDLGSFDGKQMYHLGRMFTLEAKFLLRQLRCLGTARGMSTVLLCLSTSLHLTPHLVISGPPLCHFLPSDSEKEEQQKEPQSLRD